ncbi:MAG: PilZ domain-containing protein [Spirochaetes bacterium]|nr:PilZ domain-containing protein [Spirochaetota bacterium]
MSNLRLGNKEKRDYIRMNIDTEVGCKIRGSNEEFKGKCKNLSHTGLQFTTAKPLKEGSELDIILQVSGAIPQAPLRAVLAVKRVIKESEDSYVVSGKLKDVK